MTTVHTLTIDSRDRDFDAYPDPSNYRIMLPRKYRNVEAARVISAEIPSSFYVFSASAGNTTLPISVQGNPAVDAIVLDGNYNAETICVALEDALETATGLQWTAVVSMTTMKLTLQNSTSAEFELGPWTSSSSDVEWGLGYYLGFESDATYASSGGSLTSPRPIQLNPRSYLLVDVEELNGIDEAGIGGSAMGRGSFCKVPIQVNSFEFAFLDSSKLCNPLVKYRPPISVLDRMRIRHRFHDGRLVDFHGVEHSLTVEIHTRDPAFPPINQHAAIADAASTAAAAAAAAAVASMPAREVMVETPVVIRDESRGKKYKYHAMVFVGLTVLAFGFWWLRRKRTVNMDSASIGVQR